MSGYLVGITVGAIGWLLYRNRYNLLTNYHVYRSNGFEAAMLSFLFPNNIETIGNVEIVSFTQGGKVYYYPLLANADKTLSIGHRLLLCRGNYLLDITPPAGIKLKISSSDFGEDYYLSIGRGDDVKTVEGVVEWPLEEAVIVED